MPVVESSFSMMNNIVDLRSGRTEIDTYSAIMSVKNQLKSAGVTASSKFHRKIFKDPVDEKLCYYMQASCFQYKKRLSSKQEVMLKQQGKLTTKINPKIKGAKKKKQSAWKVTLKAVFHFGSFFFMFLKYQISRT